MAGRAFRLVNRLGNNPNLKRSGLTGDGSTQIKTSAGTSVLKFDILFCLSDGTLPHGPHKSKLVFFVFVAPIILLGRNWVTTHI